MGMAGGRQKRPIIAMDDKKITRKLLFSCKRITSNIVWHIAIDILTAQSKFFAIKFNRLSKVCLVLYHLTYNFKKTISHTT
jgi:hypothetical protein